jgi:predicted DNA-binding transcriptional regulator AlpA
MEILEKNFDISNTIEVGELAKRWGVSKKTIDNRRYRGQGPSYFKIGGKIKYDLDDVKRMENDSYISVNGTR